jgi:hypothetical protein
MSDKLMPSEEALLHKFKEILEMSQEVKQSQVAKSLKLSDDDLFEFLLKWRHLGFKLKADSIVVEDLNRFISALDGQFAIWSDAESTKNCKVDINFNPQNPIPSPVAAVNLGETPHIKKVHYFLKLAENDLAAGNFTEANQNAQEAVQASKDAMDLDLTLQVRALQTRITQAQTEADRKKERLEKEEAALNAPMDFHGVQVIKRDGLVLQALEGMLNKAFHPNSTSAPGFQIDNQHVVRLDLDGLGLSSLPERIGNFSSLKELNVYTNQLISLPASIGQLNSLQRLDVSYNQLASLPDSIGNLKSLTWLNLEKNSLSSLPDSIGNLSALRDLRLHSNKLASLPDSIGQLKSLTYLELNSNQISSLPDSIGQLKSLTYLKLYSNQISSLPDSIGNLNSLQTLNISYNKLTSLPEKTENALKKLQQHGCSIFR